MGIVTLKIATALLSARSMYIQGPNILNGNFFIRELPVFHKAIMGTGYYVGTCYELSVKALPGQSVACCWPVIVLYQMYF